MNEFTKARLKLTLLYIFISALMLAAFTIAAINAEQRAFNRIEQALADKAQRPKLTALLEQRINEFGGDFRRRLIIINGVLLLLASGTSFYLSGQTLKPIEKMLKAQQEFAADASHELRTPLTTINMEIEALKRTEKIPSKVDKTFFSIQEEIVRMKNLVEGLLVLIREPTDLQKNWTKVDLNEAAKEVFEKLRPLAKNKKLEYVILGSETRPESKNYDPGQARMTIQGNPDQLKQVVSILLDNAIKYTPKDGKVELSLLPTTNYRLLTVSDTGPGIPEKDLPHIFDRFYRGKSKESGSGLGLAIAKKITEEHGGKISVESELDKGTKFKVHLPNS